jgi:hypothetical protein
MAFPTPNPDESLVSIKDDKNTIDAPFIGNFHKTLPHNKYGEVCPDAYRQFERTCLEIEAGSPINFESVPKGPLPSSPSPCCDSEQCGTAPQSCFHPNADPDLVKSIAKFTSPLAGAAIEAHGPDPKTLEMLPAPGIRSLTTLAEMVELYWMALLRDVPLLAFQEHSRVIDNRVDSAIDTVKELYDYALCHDNDFGKLRTSLDVAPDCHGGAHIFLQTLFRGGLHDEEFGPLVSQFFLRDIGYGVQTIDQKLVPYIAGHDFLTTHGDWLLAQNTGKDKYGRDYGNCNNYSDQIKHGVNYYPCDSKGKPIKRYISTMRDLARFVNRDALHQAYFNAALFLDGIGAPLDEGNPYRGNRYSREGAFATLGGPDLLTLVSEVSSRALKVVWRQKWLVHRRCRPEVFGGLIQMQCNGYNGCKRNYGLPIDLEIVESTLQNIESHNDGTAFLPMAFSAGSPNHPAYGAGHATVAGACVTVLKAWFDEDAKLENVFKNFNEATNKKTGPKDPPLEQELKLLQPGCRSKKVPEVFSKPQKYDGNDTHCITVGGELNKIASNVAMGRSMGGVHWRTDNTRSLRLGEEIAIEILRKRTMEYAERPVSFTFRSFDRQRVHISRGQVRKDLLR